MINSNCKFRFTPSTISLTDYRQANVCMSNTANAHSWLSRISLQNSSNLVYKFCKIYPFSGNFKTDIRIWPLASFGLLRWADFPKECCDSVLFGSSMSVPPVMTIATRLVQPIEDANGKQDFRHAHRINGLSKKKRKSVFDIVLFFLFASGVLALALHCDII